MPRAVVLIRDEPHYRREAFISGMRNIGMTVLYADIADPVPGDVLVIWNRYGQYHQAANRWEKARAKVIIAENGYYGKDAGGLQRYALALHGHNGSGTWHIGGPERLDELGIKIQPWRTGGKHILVCGQRGIGSPTMASPPNWHVNVAQKLAKLSKRPIKIRAHPGTHAPRTHLSDDLSDAWACVIWSSACGVAALIAGIPVIYQAPYWICSGAADRKLECIDKIDDGAWMLKTREQALQRMAWAQWTLDEITSGEPFRLLMDLQ